MKALAALVLLLGVAMPTVADPVQFRDDARNISFSYNDRVWKPINLEGSDAQVRIEWRLLGGEYLADCYLRANPSAFAVAMEGRVHERASKIVEGFTAMPREFDPEAQLLINENIVIGTQELVHLRQRFVYSKGHGFTSSVVLDTLYTARDGEDVIFECKRLEWSYQGDDLISLVEREMRLVWDSLSFGN